MKQNNSPLVLGTESIPKLLTQYALPAIIAMTASSLYNMIDSIFIGQGVGPLAISGLALTFPLMNLAAAFGSMVGIGASSLVSVRLGQRDYDSASNILGNVMVLNVVIGILFSVICYAYLDPILYYFGASEQTISYARDYMVVTLIGNVVTHIYFGLNAVLRSSGYPQIAMITTLASVIVNCFLNALFIFVWDWGIAGAAWATVLSQFLALMYQLIHFSNQKNYIHFKRGIYKLKKEIVVGILSIGMSPFLMNLCACLVVIMINKGLKTHGGDMAIGAYGIVNRIAFLFVMIVMGLNQGMQPIVGYNYGARQYGRVLSVLKYTMVYAVCISTSGALFCELFPEFIASMFTQNEELIEKAAHGLRIVMVAFPLVGLQMVAVNFFQSLGMARKAIILSLTRQLIFLIPALYILPMFLGLDGVWLSMPFADVVATTVSVMVLYRQYSKFKQIYKEESK
jgi:putative MATE family efflux protein